jgi:DNA-directed RNA polymerase subunit M/transcription elongation factor TFIIS
MEHNLHKYFSKQKNIDYIVRKTCGPDQKQKIYEILCLINNPENKNKFEGLNRSIDYLKNNKLLWLNPTFDNERKKVEEENDFMVCPYEISEGVLECGKCGCKKIFSFSKQTRSMDEPTTVFGLCSECGHKWHEGS